MTTSVDSLGTKHVVSGTKRAVEQQAGRGLSLLKRRGLDKAPVMRVGFGLDWIWFAALPMGLNSEICDIVAGLDRTKRDGSDDLCVKHDTSA